VFIAAWLLLFGACRDLGPQSLEEAETITTDYSGIADPRARWEAYQLKSYVLEQQRMCFCINGGETCLVYVSNDKVVDVVRKSDGQSVFREFGFLYKAANQLLDLADSLKAVTVARLVVEYDTKFGFPRYIYVDPIAQMADEEYGYLTTSVRKLLK
jgi:hypothetical protein